MPSKPIDFLVDIPLFVSRSLGDGQPPHSRPSTWYPGSYFDIGISKGSNRICEDGVSGNDSVRVLSQPCCAAVMAELHEALKSLGPVEWSDVPKEGEELSSYLKELFAKSQLILESLPVHSPEHISQPRDPHTHCHTANASEVTSPSGHGSGPSFGHEKFQKEWGKPLKLKPSENPLGLSVYKMPGKDGKGAWFARQSVHEDIGFARFKRSLEIEFDKSLAEPGPPGTGNVRGIGGEERVEQIKTKHGSVEVYRLSAQFPGPTTARDFVTMLVTSDKAIHIGDASQNHLLPRHYMIISKSCDHPKTQPRSGFVRGFYESVEFIREVPRKIRISQSSIDLSSSGKHQRPETSHGESNTGHARHRAATVGQPGRVTASRKSDLSDPEANPVEWIMITRSDPGGGIPRFLVERGTPASICQDAVKFIDWACQNEEDTEIGGDPSDQHGTTLQRIGSHQSWKARSLIGIAENEQTGPAGEEPNLPPADEHEQHGLYDAVAGAAASLRPYTPQVILNRFPDAPTGTAAMDSLDQNHRPTKTPSPGGTDEDQKSVTSTTSFASAEERWSSEPDGAEAESLDSATSFNPMNDSREQLQHEKELRRLDERKQALQKKFSETQTKYDDARTKQAETSAHQTQKTLDKYERERKKHEEKFQRELAKIEQKQDRERKKVADRARKQVQKDEHAKLKRERDEARQELQLAKKEAESLRQIVADLQKENTSLVIKLGKAGLSLDPKGNRSRGSSLSRKEKKDSDLAVASAAASMKGDKTGQSGQS